MGELRHGPPFDIHPLDRLELEYAERILSTPTPWDEALRAMYGEPSSLALDEATQARLDELDLKPTSYTQEEMGFIEQCYTLSDGPRRVFVQNAADELGRELERSSTANSEMLAYLLSEQWARERDIRDFDGDAARRDIASAGLRVIDVYPHPRDAEFVLMGRSEAQVVDRVSGSAQETMSQRLRACDDLLSILYGDRYDVYNRLCPQRIIVPAQRRG